MALDFDKLRSTVLPDDIDMPMALKEDVEYVFSVTNTDPDAMEIKGFAEATARVLERDGRELGTYPPPMGHEGLRQFICDQLKANRGLDVSVDNVFLTSGAGGACQTILDAFVAPGDVVMMDEYCYHGSLNMFLKKGARLIHVEMDNNGMIPDALEREIKNLLSDEGVHPKMIYTIPVYHNPTGATLSLERRNKLVDISNRYQIPIVENESYADFRLDGPLLPPSMMSLDSQEGVMYISSFTKLMGCGLRLGFGVFPENARESLQKVGFGVSPSHLTSMAVHEYLKDCIIAGYAVERFDLPILIEEFGRAGIDFDTTSCEVMDLHKLYIKSEPRDLDGAYKHYVGDPPTDLTLHKNSPGYRLILNNVLFPAARKKKKKT